MQDWGSGYITDVEYEDGFYAAQAPEHLALAAAINGLEAPAAHEPFKYCELGCGRGQTSLVLAAVSPESEFHAVDFHPAHIAHARSIARAAGLDNISFHECSFDDLASGNGPALPAFDFVTMHGVWSWVSAPLQDAILRFLDAHLNPGGLVYVSYNAKPAWDRIAPLQRIVRELAAAHPDRSDAAIVRAFERLGRLVEAKIIPERFQEGFARMTDENQRLLPYLAHEYLNRHWRPLYHMDVARAFAASKLTFAACSDLLKNFYNLALTEQQRQVLREVPFPELQETLKDFCADHWFRQDVFVRGARRMSAQRREQLLGSAELTLLRPPPDVIDIRRPDGTFWRPDVTVYQRVMRALRERPARVSDLLELEDLPPNHLVRAVELVGVLVGSELAGLFRQPTSREKAAADRLNGALTAEEHLSLYPGRVVTLATPATRSGVTLSPANFLLFRDMRRGLDPDAEALARDFIAHCRAEGGHPVVDGRHIEDDAEAHAAVTKDYTVKIERLVPIWRTIGLV